MQGRVGRGRIENREEERWLECGLKQERERERESKVRARARAEVREGQDRRTGKRRARMV